MTLRVLCFKASPDLVSRIDRAVVENGYVHRSEFIRDAVLKYAGIGGIDVFVVVRGGVPVAVFSDLRSYRYFAGSDCYSTGDGRVYNCSSGDTVYRVGFGSVSMPNTGIE